MSTFDGPAHNATAGPDASSLAGKFDAAQRYVEARWTAFDDAAGVVADLAELRHAVDGTRPTPAIRTRLTLHRLRRISGNAGPIATLIAAVRDAIGPD